MSVMMMETIATPPIEMLSVEPSADDQLVLKIMAGDTAAFVTLVERYKRPVYSLAYRLLGNPTDAEDAAQETFVRAYTRLSSYQLGSKFGSWLLSITSHWCIDFLRRRRAISFDAAGIGVTEAVAAERYRRLSRGGGAEVGAAARSAAVAGEPPGAIPLGAGAALLARSLLCGDQRDDRPAGFDHSDAPLPRAATS